MPGDGKIGERVAADRAAELGIGGGDRRDVSRDRHRLRLLARLQGKVDVNILADTHRNALVLHRFETRKCRAHAVGAGNQVGCGIGAGGIRGQSPGDAPLHVGDGYGGAHDYAATGVVHVAANPAQVLRVKRRAQKQRQTQQQKPQDSFITCALYDAYGT